jgi:hypothetical protein
LIKDGSLKYPDLVKWYQKSGMKRFGVELGATGLVVGGAYLYGKKIKSDFREKIKPKGTSDEEMKKFMEPSGYY